MADQLNMGGLNLGSPVPPQELSQRSYIPPHMRGKMASPEMNTGSPPMNAMNGLNQSAWAGNQNQNYPSPQGVFSGQSPSPRFNGGGGGGWDRPRFNPSGYGGNSRGGGGGGRGGNRNYGGGRAGGSGGYWDWDANKQVIGPSDPKEELSLFGVLNDPTKQQTGINFEKYDDIPVEASGNDVPEPVLSFTNPPLDQHLLDNIEMAHYKSPTPVQKYSVPIVMGGRDLMACAQTGSGKTGGFLFPILSQAFINGPAPTPQQAGGGFGRQHKSYPTSLILAPTRGIGRAHV